MAFFRPLQLTTIEDLAGRLEDVHVTAGAEVVRQGEPGDCFFIVESGRLEALIDGVPVSELGPGDSFGEIALLRDVPRTATVRATADATLVSLAQDEFLSAVTGHTDSAAAVEAVVTSRIGAARPGRSWTRPAEQLVRDDQPVDLVRPLVDLGAFASRINRSMPVSRE